MKNTTRRVLNYFLQGCLFIVPVAVTIYVLLKAILWIDGLLPFQVPVKIPGITQIEIPGLGLIVLFLLVSLIGYIGTKYLRNPLFAYLEKGIEKAPLLKLIYSSVKDLVGAFVGEKKSFNHPVMVLVQKDTQLHRIGFITKEDISELGMGSEMVAVYLPFSYGFNGQLVIVPRENVKQINASGTEMMKFIISGGVTEI